MSYGRPPSFLAPFTPLYRKIVYKVPEAARAWRYVGHRESRPPFRRTFAVRELHDAIMREFGHRKGGIFFEAGANDGLLFSNTAYLERYLGWTGILVEALPHKYIECLHNRRRAIVEHCALVAPDYSAPSVELRYCNLMSFAPALTTVGESRQCNDGREFMSQEERMLETQAFFAPARTISDILQKHRIKRIDLMVLDMEGAELQAMRGINFKETQINNILIEARDLELVDQFLVRNGYHLHAKVAEMDFLYRRDCPDQTM